MPYTVVLLVHSWLRWLVVALGIVVLARMLAAGDTLVTEPHPARVGFRLHRAFIAAVDLQFLLGLSLYLVLSPTVRAAWADAGAAMSESALRFYFVEHAFGMIVAVGAAHVAWGRARSGQGSPRVPLAAQSAWLLITLASIPWPFLDYGRPLFRLGPY
jgi:hypothetical protein